MKNYIMSLIWVVGAAIFIDLTHPILGDHFLSQTALVFVIYAVFWAGEYHGAKNEIEMREQDTE